MSQRYALLIAPSSNRVYAGEAPRLTEAELSVFGEAVLGARPRDPAPVRIGGVTYVGFSTDEPLSARDIAYLSNVSSAYALFGVEGDQARAAGSGDCLLRPVALTPLARYDDDLITIPKYAGKTNEQFTRLLLNVTVLGSARAGELLDRRLVVLDPLCGRGTTLNQALMYGYDAVGIEADGGHVDAYSAFLRTWLRRKRLKHSVELHPVRQEHKRVARRLVATVAPTKEAHRAGDTQQLTVLHADTVQARRLLRPSSCDVVVTDTPYGIAHRARTVDLLKDALPVWAELLRRGGALGLSFNTHAVGRDELAALLDGAGLTVAASPAYQRFAHWVDQGITRDLLVARK